MPSGRYIKVNMTSCWGSSLVAMTTLHACDSDGVKWNDETMTHTYGSIFNGSAAECSDTNTSNYFQFQVSSLPNWWKVDLGQSRDIAKFKTQVLSGYADRNMKDFTVQVSDDDVSWTTILTEQTANDSTEQEFLFPHEYALPPTAELTFSGLPAFFLPALPSTAELTLVALAPSTGCFFALPFVELALDTLQPGLAIVLPAPSSEMVISVHSIQCGNFAYPPMAGLIFVTPPLLALDYIIPKAAVVIAVPTPAYVWNINDADLAALQTIYKCYLTGDAETPALDDLGLPISSFQATLRDGEPSYIACVVPNATDYVDDIVARSHGEIVVRQGYRLRNGLEPLIEIGRVDYESIRMDRGARNNSATISGHATTTSTGGSTREATGLSYYALQASGSRRIRAMVDMWLRCGDIVQYELDGEQQQFSVGEISYTVSPRQAIMEVAEG